MDDSSRSKLSKLELVPVIGPVLTISKKVMDKRCNLDIELAPRQENLYAFYLFIHAAAAAYSLGATVQMMGGFMPSYK